jgi:acyl-CoA thioesterase
MRSPLNEELGIEVDDRADGSVCLALLTGPEHLNEVGSVHGGITTLLLDGAMGRCAGRTLTQGQICATVQLSVQFLAPAEGRIVAVGRVVRRGRTTAFLEGECTRADGTLIARAQGTWIIR